MVDNDPTSVRWKLSMVYDPTNSSVRPQLWDYLNDIDKVYTGPWMMIGDFNVIISCANNRGGRRFATTSRGGFQGVVDNNALIDIGFRGNSFTWSNKRVGAANIQERLDRGLANELWKVQFPHAFIHHLPASQSDHCPLLLRTNPSPSLLMHPFKFETIWADILEAKLVIQEAWSRDTSFVAKLKSTKIALKKWNKEFFGNVKLKIKKLKKHILELQTQPWDRNGSSCEETKQRDLDELLRREEALWRDKAKAKWTGDGDANTHFFYLSTLIHRRYNTISQILNSSN